jgi:hypothetical protein
MFFQEPEIDANISVGSPEEVDRRRGYCTYTKRERERETETERERKTERERARS